jgi:hypothetical protein
MPPLPKRCAGGFRLPGRAAVIRYVAAVRQHAPDGQDIDPRVAESLIQQALGEQADCTEGERTRGAVQVILLSEIITSANLDAAGLDSFLADARMLADQLMS